MGDFGDAFPNGELEDEDGDDAADDIEEDIEEEEGDVEDDGLGLSLMYLPPVWWCWNARDSVVSRVNRGRGGCGQGS